MEIAITSAARIGGQQAATAAQDHEIEKTKRQEAKGTRMLRRYSRAYAILISAPRQKLIKIG